VKAHDPVAMEAARRAFPSGWIQSGKVELVAQQYDALKEADALALVTEWHLSRNQDFHLMRKIMKQSVIFDERNIYDPDVLTEFDFEYGDRS
jgi:UDPglucose 6-dehydrogenase